eukprot:1581788-Pyramimonas_sp.AAC.1
MRCFVGTATARLRGLQTSPTLRGHGAQRGVRTLSPTPRRRARAVTKATPGATGWMAKRGR